MPGSQTNGKEENNLLDRLLRGITNESCRAALTRIHARDPHQFEFLEAVNEVCVSLQPVFDNSPELVPVLEQLCEPERVIVFRVPWLTDQNNTSVNRGLRVQFSSACGPYKGGLRFHPSVNMSIIKMLGFEQIFKNALTGISLGAGKGGSDFDPKGKSDGEIMRFCQSFMTELAKYISDDQDVPAGDIGVGAREIGYLFGHYKRITSHFQGVLTGKGQFFGGSICRPEATGFGVVFLAREALADIGKQLEGARCAVSGAGNVARFCALMLVRSGAKVLALSDSKGAVIEPEGFTEEQLSQIQLIKSKHSGDLADYKGSPAAKYYGNRAKPWGLEEVGPLDLAFPCATQNELGVADVRDLVAKGCWAVVEGANMPCTADAVDLLHGKGVIHIPGKMANAGGVAVSGLEMAQNRMLMAWTGREVYEKLENVMKGVYSTAKACSKQYGVDLASGANIAAFLKVAEAMVAQGAV